MPTLILFDIDGTLLLTGGAGARAMTRAFADVFGVESGFAGIPMAGRLDPQILDDALARAGIEATPADLDRFRARYCAWLEEEIAKPHPDSRVMPGIQPLLESLAVLPGVHLALLTGNYLDGARIKLGWFDLWGFFQSGAFGEDAPVRAGLLPVAVDRAASLGFVVPGPGAIVVVGDTPIDVACARQNGARSVGVATGPYSVDELRTAGADITFADLVDGGRFLGWLDELENNPSVSRRA